MAAAGRLEGMETDKNAESVRIQDVSSTPGSSDSLPQAAPKASTLPNPARPRYSTDKSQIDKKISAAKFDKLNIELKNLEKKLDIKDLELDRKDSDFRLEHRARIMAERKLRNRDSAKNQEIQEKDRKIAILEKEVQAKTTEEARDLRIQRLESDFRLEHEARIIAEDKLRDRDSDRLQELKEKTLNVKILRASVQASKAAMDSLEAKLQQQSHELQLTNDKVEVRDRKIENLVQSSQSAKMRFEEELQLKDREINDLIQSSQSDKVRYLEETQLKEHKIKDLIQMGRGAQARYQADQELNERKMKDLVESNQITEAQLQKEMQIKDQDLEWKNRELESKAERSDRREKTIQRLREDILGLRGAGSVVEFRVDEEQGEEEDGDEEEKEDQKDGWEDGSDELDAEQTEKRVWDCWNSKY